MKVLQIATSSDGGAGIAAGRLNSALNAIGVDSILLSGSSTKKPKNPNEIATQKGLMTRNLSRAVTVLQAKFLQKHKFLMTPISLETMTVTNVLAHNPDIVHLHTFYNLFSTDTVSEICNLGIPVFITLHDERFYTGGCHHALNCPGFKQKCLHCPETRAIFQKIPFRAQRDLASAFSQSQIPTVIAPSEWIASRARMSKVLKDAEVVKVNNPIGLEFVKSSEDFSDFQESSGTYLITYVAQNLQNPYKGLETLLDCISKYEEEFKAQDVKFTFVGKGDEIEIGNLKATQYTKLEASEMLGIYFQSDLLIVPSLVDNSPNVIFEALACGTPFVGSDQAGIPEISDAFGMESFKFADPDSMYTAIIKQKKKDMDARKIREAALALVHPEVVAKKVEELYKSKLTSAS